LGYNYDLPLCENIESFDILKKILRVSKEKIYAHKQVLQIEAAGFVVIPGLLDTFLSAIAEPDKSSSKKILGLIPKEYIFDFKEKQYDSIMSITTYVAGMTDNFAIDTYRNLRGIQLPNS